MATTAFLPEDVQGLIEFALSEVEASYRDSSEDRAELHRCEWDAPEDAPSVLGTMELRTDAVVGAVRSMMRTHIDAGKVEAMKALRNNSVYSSPTLSSWMRERSIYYPAYARHIQSVEYLRTVAMWTWRNEKA